MTSNISFRKGTKARKKRSEIAEALKREKARVRSPFAVATSTVKKMRRLDPWEDPDFMMEFDARVRVLYMTREDIEDEVAKGGVSREDFQKYWEKVGAQHLEEVAISVPSRDAPRFMEWVRTWRHQGGSWYLRNRRGFAVRAGGANQTLDPLNVFFLFPRMRFSASVRMRGLPQG